MRKFRPMINVILVVALLISLLPQVVATENKAIRILTGTEITVSLAGGTIVQVQTELTDTLRWQIYSPEYDVWADISGKTGTMCEVVYAMVCNALDDDGVAKIRCCGGDAISDTITVSVDYSVQDQAAMPLMLSAASLDSEAALIDLNSLAGEADEYNVKVRYLYYSTQETVEEAWNTKVSAEISHTLEVPIPSVLGYEPYYQGELIDGDTVTITTGVLDSDVTYVVYYLAADVQYTVIHYKQNVDNDNYIPVLTETLMGPTDSLVGEVEKDFTGFSALLYEHPVIAADGSTVVDIYYDREYYLMNFDLGDEGYGVYPIYARYETAVSVDTPVRAGYTFLGWEPELPITVPAENTSYTAQWQQVDSAKVSIVVWGENGSDEQYSYLNSYTYYAKPGSLLTYTDLGLVVCGERQHVHSAYCDYDCGKAYHQHGEACCMKTAHTHDLDCCTLGHIHTDGCYANCDHSHTPACYGGTTTPSATDLTTRRIERFTGLGLENGCVYGWEYEGSVMYFLYFNDSWYYTSSNNAGRQLATSGLIGESTYYNKYRGILTCSHPHTIACYGGTTGNPDDTRIGQFTKLGLENGCVYAWKRTEPGNSFVYYYLYFDNEWYYTTASNVGVELATSGLIGSYTYYYKYSGVLTCTHTGPHDDSCLTCTQTEHDHTSGCVYCDLEEHQHSADSCSYCSAEEHSHDDCTICCEITVHTHTDSCYSDEVNAKPDGALYYYVGSDTVTVKADGSTVLNVFYDRTIFTLSFKDTGEDGEVLAEIRAKWGANIRDKFQTISKNNTFRWSRETDGSAPWTHFVNVMPKEDRTYYANSNSSGISQIATYYGEVVGEATGDTLVIDGVAYEALYSTNVISSTMTVSAEDFEKIEGYVCNEEQSSVVGDAYHHAEFFYDRELFTINFNDGFSIVDSGDVKFGASLSVYADWIPAVPAAYDENGYYFDGWYLNPECTGTPYDLNSAVMPADDLILYAKWSLKTHTVNFYQDSSLTTLLNTYEVLHSAFLTEYPTEVTNGSYEFLYWFYMNGDAEKAFDPENMAIFQDMNVYAKWNSNAMRPYILRYETVDGEGLADTTVWVADLSEDSGLVGTTKTFDAKRPEELFDGYQFGYFPTARSHDFVLSLDGENGYTFQYQQKDVVPYTVRYLELTENGTAVPIEGYPDVVVSDNGNALVTETSIAISGYRADAYQKRLIVVAEETEEFKNEIVFYYSKLAEGEENQEYYRISHYIETLNGSWLEYQYEENSGIVGETYSENPLDIPGFTYDEENSTREGKLISGGMHLQLFYTRNSYNYVVNYLDVNGDPMLDSKEDSDKYESVITETAPSIIGYEIVGESIQTIIIRQEESDQPQLNIINFYYQEKVAQFTYVVVGPEGSGTVSLPSESTTACSGQTNGSKAEANEGFCFVGWYMDEACKIPVDEAEGILDGTTFTPVKKDGAYIGRTYYAKFYYNVTNLTISKTGDADIDENQSFLFRIYSEEKGVDLTVAIVGNRSVTVTLLPVGTYTITELTGWSWRYTPESAEKEVTVVYNQDNSVSFTHSRTGLYWLDGNNNRENQFD